jgi:hypothetical protein
MMAGDLQIRLTRSGTETRRGKHHRHSDGEHTLPTAAFERIDSRLSKAPEAEAIHTREKELPLCSDMLERAWVERLAATPVSEKSCEACPRKISSF